MKLSALASQYVGYKQDMGTRSRVVGASELIHEPGRAKQRNALTACRNEAAI